MDDLGIWERMINVDLSEKDKRHDSGSWRTEQFMEKKIPTNTFRSLDPAGLKFLENKSKLITFSCRKTIK